jgi:hypothetical protein
MRVYGEVDDDGTDDFEVSVFLKEQTSRHSVVAKQKTFGDKPPLTSNSNKLTGWLTRGTDDAPIELDGDDVLTREEEEDAPIIISDIPEAPKPADKDTADDSDDALFVHSDSEDDTIQSHTLQASKRRRQRTGGDTGQDMTLDEEEGEGGDDKKKLALRTRYDGFAIYGRIVCLLVKRRTGPGALGVSTGQAMIESWVSTQVARELGLDADA